MPNYDVSKTTNDSSSSKDRVRSANAAALGFGSSSSSSGSSSVAGGSSKLDFVEVESNEESHNSDASLCCKKQCCPGLDCAGAKWTFARFAGLCLLAVLILIAVYGMKSDSGAGKHRR